jgi:hypothetical protein
MISNRMTDVKAKKRYDVGLAEKTRKERSGAGI